jgi:hypothetical protein
MAKDCQDLPGFGETARQMVESGQAAGLPFQIPDSRFQIIKYNNMRYSTRTSSAFTAGSIRAGVRPGRGMGGGSGSRRSFVDDDFGYDRGDAARARDVSLKD